MDCKKFHNHPEANVAEIIWFRREERKNDTESQRKESKHYGADDSFIIRKFGRIFD